MDSEEQVLVGGSSDHVCCCEELPVKWGGVAEEVGAGELESNDAEDDIFCERLRATELRDLVPSIEVSSKIRFRDIGVFSRSGLCKHSKQTE